MIKNIRLLRRGLQLLTFCWLSLFLWACGEKKVEIEFLTSKEAAQFLVHEDEYIQNMSLFDLNATFGASTMPSREQRIEHYENAIKDWPELYQKKINAAIAHLNEKIKDLGLDYPDKIPFILYKLGDSRGSAYTRMNAIIWPEDFMLMDDETFNRVIAHEFFHVYSRYHKAQNAKLYAPLHYQQTEVLTFPPALNELRITNPDAPVVNYAIELEYQGKKQFFMPILLAKRPYDATKERWLFRYLSNKFLAVDISNGVPSAVIKDGKPLLMLREETNFDDVVAPNTSYLLNPEEISAENFSLWVVDAHIPHKEPVDALIEVMKTLKR